MINFDFSILSESGQYDPKFGMMCWLPRQKWWDIFTVDNITFNGKGRNAIFESWDAVRGKGGEDGKITIKNLSRAQFIPLTEANAYYLVKTYTEDEYVRFLTLKGDATVFSKEARLVFKVDRSNDGLMYKLRQDKFMPLQMRGIRHKFIKHPISGEYVLPKKSIL